MSRKIAVLAAHSIRRLRPMLMALALVLAGFQFLLTQVAVYLMQNQAFGMLSTLLPEFVRSMAGPTTLLSFGGVVSLGYFHPIVIVAFVGLAVAVATEPAGEVETRFVDLTLARPLARTAVVTRTLIVLVASVTLVLATMVVGTWTGLACCTPTTAPRPAASLILSLALNLAMIAWCWGGIALAAGAAASRRATASGLIGVAALAAYLLDYLGRVWAPARLASRFSPFHYFEPMGLVAGAGLSGWNVSVLFALGAAGTALSYRLFGRRDL
jgi:beta-exotoxin I transport system permease protein